MKCSANRKVLDKHNGALSLLIKISLICTQLSEELWGWWRLLRVPWTARSNQSIIKEISLEYSLEGLMLKLKFQHVGHLMQRALEKTLMLGKTEGRRRRGRQRMRWSDGIIDSMDVSLSKFRETVKGRDVWGAAVMGLQRVGHDSATKQQMCIYMQVCVYVYVHLLEGLES